MILEVQNSSIRPRPLVVRYLRLHVCACVGICSSVSVSTLSPFFSFQALSNSLTAPTHVYTTKIHITSSAKVRDIPRIGQYMSALRPTPRTPEKHFCQETQKLSLPSASILSPFPCERVYLRGGNEKKMSKWTLTISSLYVRAKKIKLLYLHLYTETKKHL